MDVDAVVIGSGPGGMAAALCLAKAGKRVVVFEQHTLPGGWSHTFNLGGYDFSPGVHYIGECQEGGRMRALYEGLGVANDLVMHELNPDAFDVVRVGDQQFDLCKGQAALTERLIARFPAYAVGIRGWFEMIARMQKELESGTRVQGLGGLLSLPARVPTLTRHGLRTVDAVLDSLGLTDPVLRAVLSVQAGDHGVSPDRAPMAMHAAIVGHYFEGGWYPRGGARSIPKAFIKALRKHGGEIRTGMGVSQILLEGKVVRGVRLADGTEVRADIVVSNADPGVTFQQLLPREALPYRLRAKLARTTWSISAISLFFAARFDAEAAGLHSGNLWSIKRPDVAETYRFATAADPLATELPGLFLTTTTLKDRTKLKQGVHTFESFCFVSYDAFSRWASSRFGDRPADYEAMKEELQARMFTELERLVPGISKQVEFAALGTPLSNVHYCNSTQGNLYGIAKRRSQVGPFSFGVKTPFSGLFLCGASTMGHGVAGATFSGVGAARAALGCRTSELLGATGQSLRCLPADHPEQWPSELQPRSVRDVA